MKHLRFFAGYLFSTKILLCCLFLFSFSFSFITPTTTFAQTATAVATNITAEDVARWKKYADTSFANPTYAMYKSVFYSMADLVFTKYKNTDPVTGFNYVMDGTPGNDTVNWGSASDIKGVRNLAEEEKGKTALSGTDRQRIDSVMGVLAQMIINETAYNAHKAGSITTAQYNTILTNAKNNYNAAAASETAKLAGEASKKCTNILSDFTSCIDEGFAWLITHTLLAFAGYFLWVTATMMNYAINIGILQFSSWAPDTLYPIWIIIRQIVSLFIVFAGLWLGFMYIINQGDNFKKYIPKIVIFALFVNFSYPLTRAIIDISNVISLNLYASAVGSNALEAGAVNILGDKTAGAIIRDRLGLSGLIDFATGDTKTGESALNSINSTPAALLAVLFILYAAWIFFLISALIITRTAVLVFLIIASPILLVDGIIPKLGEQATSLRKIFWEQLFVGPVFAIMLAVTLKFLEVFQKGPLASGSIGGKASSIVMFFNILMMLIMLHIMLKVVKATSGKIGEAVSGTMGKIGGTLAGGAILGGAGALGRATLGRAAAAARDSKWVTSRQDSFIGRKTRDMSSSLANKTFDGRNSSFVKSKMADVGMTLGMGGKMGYEQVIDAREKDRVGRLSSIGTHKKNVYDDKGKLLHKKGSLDTSAEAMKIRENYISTAGGLNTGVRSLFTPKQEQNDVKQALKDKEPKAVTKLNEMNLKTQEDKKNIEAFINNPDNASEKEKLQAAYTKKIIESYNTLETDTERGAFKNIYNLPGDAKNLAKIKEAELSRILTNLNAMDLGNAADKLGIENFKNSLTLTPEEEKRFESTYAKKITETYSKIESDTERTAFRNLYKPVAGALPSKNFENLNDAEISKKAAEYSATKNTASGKTEKDNVLLSSDPSLKNEVVEIVYKKALDEYKKINTKNPGWQVEQTTFYNNQSREIQRKLDDYNNAIVAKGLQEDINKDLKNEARVVRDATLSEEQKQTNALKDSSEDMMEMFSSLSK